jgi:hypothetical protein
MGGPPHFNPLNGDRSGLMMVMKWPLHIHHIFSNKRHFQDLRVSAIFQVT